jgi:hypothetical protein
MLTAAGRRANASTHFPLVRGRAPPTGSAPRAIFSSTAMQMSDNLLNEFYISDRVDGMKPGMARTIWTGFKYKF